jgi:hypothetical protein
MLWSVEFGCLDESRAANLKTMAMIGIHFMTLSMF